MGKKVTVYDIAEELGISAATVSRVLNNSTLISSGRAREIRETAERLGYRKRSIRRQVGRAILNLHLFLPETDAHLTHFFYNISELIDSVRKGFGEVRLNFVTRVNDGNLEFLERKKTGQIDGCLFAFTLPSLPLQEALRERDIPFLLLNRRSGRADAVCSDTTEGMRLLARRMVQAKGRELRPCYIAFRGLPEVSEQRFQGAASLFREEGIPFGGEAQLCVEALEEVPRTALDWVLERGYNGVLAFNDLTALSFLQTGLARGVRFPQDLLLSGYDDSPIQALLDRRIDTVRLSLSEMGRQAGIWLKARIIDKDPLPLELLLPAEYLPGDTIG